MLIAPQRGCVRNEITLKSSSWSARTARRARPTETGYAWRILSLQPEVETLSLNSVLVAIEPGLGLSLGADGDGCGLQGAPA